MTDRRYNEAEVAAIFERAGRDYGTMTALMAGAVLMVPLLAGAQTPPPAAAQNPSPMVESTRAHERLAQRDVGGAVRSFVGPAGKTVELWIPDQARTRETVNVVVHFHGAAWLAHQAVARLGTPTVAAVVNLGAGSGGYHRAFTEPTAFDSLLGGVEREVSAVIAKAARVGSVTLVGFSAGHGAVRAILRERRHFAKVDAVLLLDGMHTSYVPDGNVLEKGGALDTTNLTAFADFARAAIRGEKRFVVTHSEIFPGTFASTTETADWLLRGLGLRPTPVLRWGPRGMQQLSEVRAGGFEVLGFAGNSAPDHVDHLHAMPELVARLYANYAAAGRPASDAKPLHHYVFFGQDREKLATASSFFGTKRLEGAQVTYTWRQLEPERDAYDFSTIRDDLAFLTSRGKKLFIQLQDVSFNESRVNVPVYLLRDPIYNGGAARQYEYEGDDESKAVVAGWASRRWDPAVQERFHRLLFALGKEFDGRIEGINFAESSVGFGTTGRLFPQGFSFESYRDAIITNMKALKRAFPKSIAMQYGNFMPGEWRPTNDKGYLRAVYQAAAESNIAMGGPDLMPHRPGQLKTSYPLLREVAGVVPTGIAVQDGNLAEINPATGQRVQVSELVKFATDYLRVDYIFWGTEEPYFSQAVIPFLAADTGTAAEGTQAGSSDAAERSVAGRGMLGFIGGLPIGFLGTLLLQGDPGGPIGVGLGLGIIGVAWKFGDAAPFQTQSILERSEAYRRAYSESYEKRLMQRRKKAALLGGLAGAVTGLGFLFVLLSELDT